MSFIECGELVEGAAWDFGVEVVGPFEGDDWMACVIAADEDGAE